MLQDLSFDTAFTNGLCICMLRRRSGEEEGGRRNLYPTREYEFYNNTLLLTTSLHLRSKLGLLKIY